MKLNNPTNTYFSYIRKSTDDGENQQLTLAAQMFDINRFANTHGLKIVDHFEEKRSAKYLGRPVFRQMIEAIKQGKANGIIASHPDRLSRNSLDSGEIIYLLDEGTMVDLKFPHFRFENDPQGKYMLYQAFATSKFEVDTLSRRVTTAYKEKARRGEYPGRVPIGYRNNRVSKTAVVDPLRAPFVIRAFEMCASGKYSVPQIRSELTRAGFVTRKRKPVSLSKYHFILNHTFYFGPFPYGGEWYKGKHRQLITKELFDASQKQLKRQARKWGKDFKPFLYRSHLRCGQCGAAITFEVQKGHGYLRCTRKKGPCNEPYVRQEVMNQTLRNTIADISLPNDVIRTLKNGFLKHKAKLLAKLASQKKAFEKTLGELRAREDRCIDLLVNGVMSDTDFKETKRKLVLEIASVEEAIARIDRRDHDPLEPATTLLKRLDRATVLEVSENEEEKLEFLKNVGSNLEINNRVLHVTWEKPFGVAAEWKRRLFQQGRKPVATDINWLLVTLQGVEPWLTD